MLTSIGKTNLPRGLATKVLSVNSISSHQPWNTRCAQPEDGVNILHDRSVVNIKGRGLLLLFVMIIH